MLCGVWCYSNIKGYRPGFAVPDKCDRDVALDMTLACCALLTGLTFLPDPAAASHCVHADAAEWHNQGRSVPPQ